MVVRARLSPLTPLRVYGTSLSSESGEVRLPGVSHMTFPGAPRPGRLVFPTAVDIVRHRFSPEELEEHFNLAPAWPWTSMELDPPKALKRSMAPVAVEPLPLPTTDLPGWGISLLESVHDVGPADQLYDIIALLVAQQGRVMLAPLAATLAVEPAAVRTLVAGMGRIVNRHGFPVLAYDADGETIVVNLEAVAQQFEVNVRRFRVFRPGGKSVIFEIPFEPSPPERKALEHLARYQRLSEAELSRLCGTRRIGGLMQLLLDKLNRQGWPGISEEAAGEQGRIYVFRDEKLP